MIHYQHMYHILCDAASRALDILPETAACEQARGILEKALEEAEECYISAEEQSDE